MSNGIHIFETATSNLQLMHNEENLVDLSSVSGDYYCTSRKIEDLQEELAAALPKEKTEKFTQLQDCFLDQEIVAREIYYNQGFADGISLMMQSLMWEAVRR
jgi:hypothetical protein